MCCLPCHSSPLPLALCAGGLCCFRLVFCLFILCVVLIFLYLQLNSVVMLMGRTDSFWMKGGVKSSSHTSGYLHIQLSFGELRERTENFI